MTPIVKSSSRPKWQRLLRRNVFYHRSIYHRFRHVLSFTFAFDKEEDVYHFAMAIPYSYSKLQAYLDVWMKKAKHLKKTIDRQTIGKSLQKRKIDLLTIGDEENEDDNKKLEKRHVVFIIARTHGGEAPTSYVCQGFMDFMISPHPMAQLLRNKVTIKVIPMVNPDGVHLGNQRTNLLGMDMNRSWMSISQWAHPALKVTHDAIMDIDMKKERYQLDFVIDLHAHTSLKGCFIYGNTYDDVYRYERHIVFPKVFAAKAEGYYADNSLFNADPSKVGTARRYFCNTLGKHTNSFTLMVSMGGYHLSNISHYIHYNEDSYLRLGRNLGKSLFEYYKQVNIIPIQTKILESRSKRSKRKMKNSKVKHIYPKLTRPHLNPQSLENRLISPSIIQPQLSQEYDKSFERSNEQQTTLPKSVTKKRNLHYSEDITEKIYQVLPSPSLPQKLAIIDLNNTIRNGLKNSIPKTTGKKFSTNERSNRNKQIKQIITINTQELFTSDEDYIDTD